MSPHKVKTATKAARPSKGGRPSAARAEQIREHILEVASDLFLKQGYGATSIEAVAIAAGISKRTFYHRFADKPALFAAVVHALVTELRPTHDAHLFTGKTRDALLQALANIILHAALRPKALALHRILVSEAARFPELATIMETHSARNEAIERIATLLQETSPKKTLSRASALFAAEQFLDGVIAVPQRRAIGLGIPMTQAEIDRWGSQAVALFLHGCDGLDGALPSLR